MNYIELTPQLEAVTDILALTPLSLNKTNLKLSSLFKVPIPLIDFLVIKT
jgi:hypothetical protein